MSRDLSSILPEKIQVVFRGRRCSGSTGQDVPAYYASSVNLSDLTLTDPDAELPQGAPGTTKSFQDAALAQFPANGGTPTNQEALDALAKQVAQDFVDWRSIAFDTVYAGIVAPKANGLFDEIVWRYDGKSLDTRVRSTPWNGEPEELQHQDPAIEDCTTGDVQHTPLIEVYGPPADCFGGGAAATATVSDGAVTSITVTSGGSGYTSAPTVQFSQAPEDGTGATATATIDPHTGKVTSVDVSNGGENYTVPPTVSFQGGGSRLEFTRYRIGIEDGRLVSYFISTDTLQ